MNRADFRFLHPLRVRWAEVDRQDVVFNGHYLLYFDVAITEYWRAVGLPYQALLDQHDADLYVVKAGLEYHGPARFDDELEIGVRVRKIGNSSIVFDLGIFRQGEHLIEGEIVYVNANPRTKKPSTVPVAVRELMAKLEGRPELAAVPI